MSVENKQVVKRFIEVTFNKHDLNAAAEYFAPTFQEHDPWPGQPPTIEGFINGTQQLIAAFPDIRCEIDDLLADEDRVVVRSRLIGTHKGQLMGIPPTEKQVQIQGIDIVRLQEGRMVDHWGVYDAAGLRQQIGAMPGPPAA